jgi:two-component system sensor histidine kinase HydH
MADNAKMRNAPRLQPAVPVVPLRPGADLRNLNRLAGLGILAAGAAHEIKNALVPLKTLISLITEGKSDPDLCEIARAELDRVESLTAGMLQTMQRSTDFSEVNLHHVLDRTLRLLAHQFTARLIRVDRRYEAESDLMRGDAGQLQQAFLNLLLNSAEAMDGGGTLSVTSELEPAEDDGFAMLRIEISDTGCGIRPEHLARLFEPFFTTKSEGTGLGLLIARNIFKDHGGMIAVASTPGKGTTFKIRLPILSRASLGNGEQGFARHP